MSLPVNPWERERQEMLADLEKRFPRSQYPYDCDREGCKQRASTFYDIILAGHCLHFCSKQCMMLNFGQDEKKTRKKKAKEA